MWKRLPFGLRVSSEIFQRKLLLMSAVLLQEGRPIEYASRASTPSERNWAQIEKEALAVLYGLERFDQYAYVK